MKENKNNLQTSENMFQPTHNERSGTVLTCAILAMKLQSNLPIAFGHTFH
jgi:hypothetical protein